MADNENPKDDHLSVRLNEAFERLEKQHQENLAKPSTVRTPRAAPAPAAPRGSTGAVLGILLSLIAIGIASYAAYMVYIDLHSRDNSQLAQVSGQVSAINQTLDQHETQVKALATQMDGLGTKLGDAETRDKQAIDTLHDNLEASISQLKSQLGTSGRDWLFAEVEYLVRLANQRVVMEHDAKGALLLFREADQIIQSSEGITAFDLRHALADNIAALEAVSEVDVDGIFVRLAALTSQVDQLKQKQNKFKPVETAPAAASTSANQTFGDRLINLVSSAGARLATLVDFRRNDEHIRPILPPGEEYYLRQNLVLKLQMAQLALLRSDQAVYVDSLNGAQSWIVQYFDPDDPVTTAMLKSLAELGAIDVSKKMPDVSSSLKEVRKLMTGFHQVPDREATKE